MSNMYDNQLDKGSTIMIVSIHSIIVFKYSLKIMIINLLLRYANDKANIMISSISSDITGTLFQFLKWFSYKMEMIGLMLMLLHARTETLSEDDLKISISKTRLNLHL